MVSVLAAMNRQEKGPNGSPIPYPQTLPFDNLMIQQKILTDRMKHPNFVDNFGFFSQKLTEIQQKMMAQMPPPGMAPMPPGPMQPHQRLPSHAGPQGLKPQGESPPPIGPGVRQPLQPVM